MILNLNLTTKIFLILRSLVKRHPGPGKHFNAFTHAYSPRAGVDYPLGTNVHVNRKPLSLCPFVASFKTISLKYVFKHILNDFIHVYSPRAGTDNPLGTKFWCQQKFLITLPIFYLFLCVVFFHMYISTGMGRQPIGDKNFMTTERPFLFAHMLQVSRWSLRNLILYTFLMILYIYLAPSKGQKPLGHQHFKIKTRGPVVL